MQDPMGYYAALEVKPNADQVQIKASYRRLAKKYHPDGSSGLNDPEKIRFLNLAYATIGNPKNRLEYDNSIGAEKDIQEESESIQPIRCHVCGKVAAFPRYLVFWRVVSLLLVTSSVPIQGIFCASCAKTEAMKSTLISATVGWWGIPWGPFITLGKGFENARGGEGEIERHEAMAWFNALALLNTNQLPLAVAIAERLLDAKDLEIQEAARQLFEAGRINGVAHGQLKDPWQQVASQAPIRFAALLTVPTAVALSIAFSNGAFSKSPEDRKSTRLNSSHRP